MATLRELGVKDGDVVQSASGAKFTVIEIGCNFAYGPTVYQGGSVIKHDAMSLDGVTTWEIVSRASDTPKLWRDMTDAEKGGWRVCTYDEWQELDLDKYEAKEVASCDCFIFRVRPEPVREVRNLYIYAKDTDYALTKVGTVETVDGKPDCGTIKMEPLE